jgi:GMP synthase-like glutamine amidotransferase
VSRRRSDEIAPRPRDVRAERAELALEAPVFAPFLVAAQQWGIIVVRMSRLFVLHHLDRTFLGTAAGPLRAAGLELEERDLKRGEPLPEPGEADAILSLGGDQSVRDLERYPYLVDEVELLRAEAEHGTPILGVCLGGQLLAHALGGSVDRLPRRIVKWAAVDKLPAASGDPVIGGLPDPVRALHWNEDGFSIPPGAVELLSRAGEAGEAFRWHDTAWGIQFHPEADGEALEGWYSDVDWLEEAGVEEAAAREADRLHLPGQRATAEGIFGGFARFVTRRAPARPR